MTITHPSHDGKADDGTSPPLGALFSIPACAQTEPDEPDGEAHWPNHRLLPTLGNIVNSLKLEPKKSKLGQFHPETKMRGRWIGYVAIACLGGSFILYELWGSIPGVILAVAAILVGKLGLDSEGRGLALVALIAGMLLTGIYLTVLILGKQNIRSV